MSDWLLDLGNTRLKLARREGDRAGAVQAFAHVDIARAWSGADAPAAGDRAWLASVGPVAVTEAVAQALTAHDVDVRFVRTQAAEGALRIAYQDPARLGVDRFLALLAASARTDGPWVLVSVGSAVTADVLAADGKHLGGLILPTEATMRDALASRFPALDLPAAEPHALGVDTAGAIASGARHALLGAMARVLAVARVKLGAEPTLLLSGGGVAALDDLHHPHRVAASSLVLDGLALWARARSD